MVFNTTYAFEDYILGTSWDQLPKTVQERAVVCAIDLFCALAIGSRGNQFRAGLDLVQKYYKEGNSMVLGAKGRFSLPGAAIAMGHSSNSFDIDDGYNMICGHPGTSVIAGVLAAALEKGITFREFLTTLVMAYESAIRSALALQDHYDYLHSTGAYGAFGTCAGMGRILGLDREQLNNAFSIADFHAPMTPVMRSVEYPSMNKDGVPFGALVGATSVLETLSGTTGKTHLLEMDKYQPLVVSLGREFYILNLYFKPYTCCRWAHAPVAGVIDLVKNNNINPEDVDQVKVHTFESAIRLSKIKPKTTDQAQYNISYPIAAALIDGDCGYSQVTEESLGREEILRAMDKIVYVKDEEIESRFPAQRLCRVEIMTKDNKIFSSDTLIPDGEKDCNIGLDWIESKFRRITGFLMNQSQQDTLLSMLKNVESPGVREIVEYFNSECVI